jgi:hypothetical protein
LNNIQTVQEIEIKQKKIDQEYKKTQEQNPKVPAI